MSKILERFDELLSEAQQDGGLCDCYAEPLRELFVMALQSKAEQRADNSASAPCRECPDFATIGARSFCIRKDKSVPCDGTA